jgi:hypothetical protein
MLNALHARSEISHYDKGKKADMLEIKASTGLFIVSLFNHQLLFDEKRTSGSAGKRQRKAR